MRTGSGASKRLDSNTGWDPASHAGATTAIPAELQLLLSCGRRNLGPEDRLHINQLHSMGGLNWDHVLRAADNHGMTPLLCSYLLNDFADELPEAVTLRLRSAFLESAQESLLQTQELGRVIRTLAAAGIRSLAYKGVALALSLYGNIGSRQSCDVDILIHQRDVLAARKALLAAAYIPLLSLPSAQECRYLAANCEMQFSSANSQVLVELQWQIVPRYFCITFDIDRFFERAVRRTIGGLEIDTLSPEDTALVLAVHGGKHAWSRFGWACDFAELLRRGNLDWNAVQADAEGCGARDMLIVAIGIAARLFDAPVPENFRHFADPRQHALIAEFCDNALRHQAKVAGEASPSIHDFALQLKLRERWADRARMLYRLAVTPNLSEWSMLNLPRHLSFLYLVVRFFRLLGKLVPAAVPVDVRQ